MTRGKPLGVTLVAAYLFLKATALLLAVTIVHTRPDLQPRASELISSVAGKAGVSLPYPTALLDVAVGLGIWFLKSWSRKLIVLVNAYGLCRMAVGSAILMVIDRKFLISQTSSPYFAVQLIAGIVILAYFLDPEVKRIFGEPE
jgi:hypothetical protein